jgi:ComF family protein
MNLTPLVSESLHLLWPARCAACDQTIPEAALFCATCSLALNPLVGVCPGCALPRHDDPRELVFAGKCCPRCVRVPLPFTSGNACFEYGESIAHAIVRMKHGKRRELARRLARLLVPSLAELLARARLAPDDVVLPVPLHTRKLRERGFNQALELAHVVAGRLALPVSREGVVRVHEAAVQAALPRAARLANLRGAFRCEADFQGLDVAVVDDVLTTGATADAMARALADAGARHVRIWAVARTPEPGQ